MGRRSRICIVGADRSDDQLVGCLAYRLMLAMRHARVAMIGGAINDLRAMIGGAINDLRAMIGGAINDDSMNGCKSGQI